MAYENIRFGKANMTVHDGSFYMMDETKDTLVQKTAGGKTAFNYPLSIDLDKHTIVDGFDVDGDLNSYYWTASSGVTASGGKVRLVYDGATSQNFNGINKILLAGNFDVSVDFNIISSLNVDAWGFAFSVRYADSSRIFQVVRSYNSGNVYYRQYWDGSNWIQYSAVSTTHTSGKLRITRSGNTFTAYYWSGTDWVSLGGVSYALTNFLYPHITLSGWTANPPATVDADNFISVVPLGLPVQLEHDGVNFWTVQNYTGDAGVLARRWQILNHVCKVKSDTLVIGNYNVNAFTVEHYHDTLASGVSAGEDIIRVNNYISTIVSGTILTLGPTTSGSNYEEVLVTVVSGQDITLSSGVSYDFDLGNNVNFYNNLWIFNNYGAGTLHKINALTGSGIATYSGSAYDDVTACTFYKVEGPLNSPKDYLVYYKNNYINYVDVSTMITDESMIIDNGSYAIYDMAVEGNNLYRLQLGQNYYGTNYGWSSYNYALSTTRRFVDNINVSAYPVILPNNATNTSKITAIVIDQYGDGVWEKPVYFTDDDTVGFITINPVYTDYFFGTGAAVSYYKAGTAVRTVTVEGTATQFD